RTGGARRVVGRGHGAIGLSGSVVGGLGHAAQSIDLVGRLAVVVVDRDLVTGPRVAARGGKGQGEGRTGSVALGIGQRVDRAIDASLGVVAGERGGRERAEGLGLGGGPAGGVERDGGDVALGVGNLGRC